MSVSVINPGSDWPVEERINVATAIAIKLHDMSLGDSAFVRRGPVEDLTGRIIFVLSQPSDFLEKERGNILKDLSIRS